MSSRPRFGEPQWSYRPDENEGKQFSTTGKTDTSSKEDRQESEASSTPSQDQKLTLRSSQTLFSGVSGGKDTTASDDGISGTRSWIDDAPSYAPSLPTRQTIYLKWSQSDPVDIIVGATEHVFRLPRDFLTRRSIPFRLMLNGRFSEAATGIIRLPEVTTATFQHVAIWLMSPEPQLNIMLPLPVTADIAIFATMYDMQALLHQALDRLRAIITQQQNVLTLDCIDRIYGHIDEHCLLRQFMRAAVSVLGNSWSSAKIVDGSLKKWQEVFERHAALGSDYFATQVKGWSKTDFAEGGPCRFHRHWPRDSSWPTSFSAGDMFGGKFCPRLSEECFEEVKVSFASNQDTYVKNEPLKTQQDQKEAKQNDTFQSDRSTVNPVRSTFTFTVNRP